MTRKILKNIRSASKKILKCLTRAGTDVLFLPSVAEIYPQGNTGLETYDLGGLETVLEGRYRPGHFQGVCQVMSRLLETDQPDHFLWVRKTFSNAWWFNS